MARAAEAGVQGSSPKSFAFGMVKLLKRDDTNVLGLVRKVAAQCGERFPDTELQLGLVKSDM